MNKDEDTFGQTQLNHLKSIANELERHTCKHILRLIFQESMEIERYPQAFRERFDIAFSQAVIPIDVSIRSCESDHLTYSSVSFLVVNVSHIFYLRPAVVR